MRGKETHKFFASLKTNMGKEVGVVDSSVELNFASECMNVAVCSCFLRATTECVV